MARRKLVVEGPKELVQKVNDMSALVGQASRSKDPKWLDQNFAQLQKLANELRMTAGNSNLSTDDVRRDLSIKDLMDLGQQLSELAEATRSQLKQAQYGPRTLDENVGTRAELAHHLAARQGAPTTAIELGLEGLEKINQTHGRGTGDLILKEIAGAVKSMSGSATEVFQEGSNLVMVGEWGSEAEAAKFAEKVSSRALVTQHGRMLRVTIGIAYEETENVMEKTSMAREQAGEGVSVFKPAMEAAKEKKRKEREQALKILKSKRFYPEYQQIHGLREKKGFFSKGPRKYEALWRSKTLSPFYFFREIKEEGLIHEVTAVMLPMILKDIAKKPKVEVSFNVTAEEMSEAFEGKSFAAFFKNQLFRHKVSPENIIIELVEWGDEDRLSDASMENLQGVLGLGCRLALDDYGVRSSNLVRLMNLCEHDIVPDFFKIDAALVKSFNKYLQGDGASAARHEHYSVLGIRSITTLVEELRRTFDKEIGIVAEFVSNEKLRNALNQEGVTHFQGFYLSEPAPAGKAF